MILNQRGDLVFSAKLRNADGSVDVTDDDEAVYAYANGKLQLVVREGDLFTVNPTEAEPDQRMIEGITIDNYGAEINSLGSGDPRIFNDRGELAMILRFTDGSTGLFVADVTPDSLLGDYDFDDDVDGSDFLNWQRSGLNGAGLDDWINEYSVRTGRSVGDFDYDHNVDGTDFLSWQRQWAGNSELENWINHFGGDAFMPSSVGATVPEPRAVALLALGLLLFKFLAGSPNVDNFDDDLIQNGS